MVVNIYHPKFWTNYGSWKYTNQTPGCLGHWKDIEYRVNNASIRDADFIVVHEDIDQSMRLKATSGGFCLVTAEEKAIKAIYHQEYLNQFDLIITSRDDIQHPNVIRCHYLHPWWVDKTYDQLIELGCPEKSKVLSSVISNLTASPGHKNRFAFINKLKGHYKENLDWFSKGENTFLPDKWDGLAPYQYSIAIENSSYRNYFTEKISDCFLAYAMPFYDGCPNITDFFDERSFVQIDSGNFMKSINIIDESIRGDLFRQNFKYVEESRTLVLEKYHFLAALTGILKAAKRKNENTVRSLKPQRYFDEGKMGRLLKAAANKILK